MALSTSANACDTSDAQVAFTDYRADRTNMEADTIMGKRFTEADIADVVARMDRRVTAAVARCRRGEVISIPRMFVNRFCDFGKHVEDNGGGMAGCVKR